MPKKNVYQPKPMSVGVEKAKQGEYQKPVNPDSGNRKTVKVTQPARNATPPASYVQTRYPNGTRTTVKVDAYGNKTPVSTTTRIKKAFKNRNNQTK